MTKHYKAEAHAVGLKIVELRGKLGISQEQLADILQKHRGTVAKWEQGQNFPKINDMHYLARALESTIAEILEPINPYSEQ